MKKIEEKGQVKNRQGWGRKKMFMDRFKNKLLHIVRENRWRSYKDITGVVNEGNNHRLCTRTIARKIQELGNKQRLAKKKVAIRKVSNKAHLSGVMREKLDCWSLLE